MNEIVAFRLLLVTLVVLSISIGGAWALAVRGETAAQERVTRSFDDYNRYIDLCSDARSGVAWDLAQRARVELESATARRNDYADRRSTMMLASLVLPTITALFYALRWAVTGKVRPLWLLGRPGVKPPIPV